MTQHPKRNPFPRFTRNFAFVLIGIGASGMAAHAASDTTAPNLLSFAIAPTQLDISAGSQAVTVNARITDDLSGNGNTSTQVRFVSPSGRQSTTTMLSGWQRTSGTALDGIYSGSLTLPRYAESGTWIVSYFSLHDEVGNYRTLNAANLSALGFPTSFVVNGTSDTTAPNVLSFTIAAAQVDVSAGSQAVTVNARITDDLSGNGNTSTQVRFTSPSGRQSTTTMLSGWQRTSGTALDGIYSGSLTLPRYAENGTWTVSYFSLHDEVGNYRTLNAANLSALGFATSFVVNGTSDTTAPNLLSFAISPSEVDVSAGSQAVTVNARITDDLSGNGNTSTQVRFTSPSGRQGTTTMLSGWQRTSGTALDGIYSGSLTLPRYAESGTWTVSYFSLHDEVGNYRTLNAANVSALGFPTSFVVLGTPLPTPTPTPSAAQSPTPTPTPTSTPSGATPSAPIAAPGAISTPAAAPSASPVPIAPVQSQNQKLAQTYLSQSSTAYTYYAAQGNIAAALYYSYSNYALSVFYASIDSGSAPAAGAYYQYMAQAEYYYYSTLGYSAYGLSLYYSNLGRAYYYGYMGAYNNTGDAAYQNAAIQAYNYYTSLASGR